MNKPTSASTLRWVARPRWITPSDESLLRQDQPGQPAHRDQIFVFFIVSFPEAQRVQLIGTFSGWEKNPIPMDRAENGTWFTNLPLASGRYEYAYLVDDYWQLDPNSPQAAHRFGPRVNQCVV